MARMNKTKKKRGVLLMIVLGVLVILAMIATVFLTLTTLEKSVSQSYSDYVRAKFISQAGIEHGIQRLQKIVHRGWFANGSFDKTWGYYGNTMDEANAIGPANVDTATASMLKAKIETALNPSFAYEDESPQYPYSGTTLPKQVKIGGTDHGLSGVVGDGTYSPQGDIFTLRVLDCSAMINVNDGMPNDVPPTMGSVSQTTARMLNTLGDLVGFAGKDPASGALKKLGQLLVGEVSPAIIRRPQGGWRSKFELLAAIGGDPKEFAKIKEYVTVASWTATDVVNPVPLSNDATILAEYTTSYVRPSSPQGLVYRYGHAIDFVGDVPVEKLRWYNSVWASDLFHNSVFTAKSLNPQWVEVVSRSPVNVNTAPREVLISLIRDLKGFFMSERRRYNPYVPSGGYAWLDSRNTYSPSNPAAESVSAGTDELGALYLTIPFTADGVMPGIPASKVADEIILCRERKQSKWLTPAVNYATVSFGGPFRSWSQFNDFCDNLVKGQLLVDTRGIFNDFVGNNNSGTTASASQWRIASFALADVLKANFNPNCHLNELNPDKTVFQYVDKTDLVVNSTEFAFAPTGCFEIESVGRVLRSLDSAGTDVIASTNNEQLAEYKTYTLVKLYDMYRETNQKQFYAGTIQPENSFIHNSVHLNYESTLNSGPEVDSGPGPSQCEYDGYLALSTYYGNGLAKAKNQYAYTNDGGALYGSQIHSHYEYDHFAHNHQAYNAWGFSVAPPHTAQEFFRHPGGAWWLGVNMNVGYDYMWVGNNWSERNETYAAPYAPNDQDDMHPSGAPSGRYTLCKSFKLPPGTSSLSGYYYAKSDLHVDGAYCEHNTICGYALWNNFRHQKPAMSYPSNPYKPFDVRYGTVAFWFKPNWQPWATGKIRTLMSMNRFHMWCDDGVNFYAYPNLPAFPGVAPMTPYALMFLPFHTNSTSPPTAPSDSISTADYSAAGGYSKFAPASLGWGMGLSPVAEYDWGIARYPTGYPMSPDWTYESQWHSFSRSPSLNHEWHGSETGYDRYFGADGNFNWLRDHEWILLAVTWNGIAKSTTSNAGNFMLYVNGIQLPGSVVTYEGTDWSWPEEPIWWAHTLLVSAPFGNTTLTGWDMNEIRIGGDMMYNVAWVNFGGSFNYNSKVYSAMRRNYQADGTIDEFFMWNVSWSQAIPGQTDTPANKVQQMYSSYGRYWKPVDSNADDSTFISAVANLASFTTVQYRTLPPLSTVAPPSDTPTQAPLTATDTFRILGVSWTGIGETTRAGTEPSGEPRTETAIITHAQEGVSAPGGGYPANATQNYAFTDVNNYAARGLFEVWIIAGGNTYGPYGNDAFSPVKTEHINGTAIDIELGTNIRLAAPGQVQYKVKFLLGTTTTNIVLLNTPIFDDMTIYYDRGRPVFLSYNSVSAVYDF